MNALALYRLTSIPEEEKAVRSQPVKKQKLLDTSVETVEYICRSCHSLVHLDFLVLLKPPSMGDPNSQNYIYK